VVLIICYSLQDNDDIDSLCSEETGNGTHEDAMSEDEQPSDSANNSFVSSGSKRSAEKNNRPGPKKRQGVQMEREHLNILRSLAE
jgi:hypothetical protein